MSDYRIEHDSMGAVEVPSDALFGAQTQRAVDNFDLSGRSLPEAFIHALLLVKIAAARANVHLKQISPVLGEAITQAAQRLLADENCMQHFPIDIFQTGSGTSTNMNVNEVLAKLASDIFGDDVHPNDHVNRGQSSNDVIPTTIHVAAALGLAEDLLPALKHLEQTIHQKAGTVDQYVKTGRTHLMDAMPIRMSQALGAWASQIRQNMRHIEALQPSIQCLAQGGTAVGTGINAHPEFADIFSRILSEMTGLHFMPSANFFSHIGSQDTAVAVSGQLKTTAVSMMKISNDLRWMNSGPHAGLGEIELDALQPGSSIMPGKVNPVIPEAVAMAAAQVIGNDATITMAGQSGSFELNVMLPLVAENLLYSIRLLTKGSYALADKAIATFRVNEARLKESLSRNAVLVTALNPIIGYAKATEIARQAVSENRTVIEVAMEVTDLSEEKLKSLLDPKRLTQGGLYE